MRIFTTAIVFCGFLIYLSKTATEKAKLAETGRVDPYSMLRKSQELLQEGDLIVRLNQDPMSRFIKNFNRVDKSYSHAGIVLFENGYPYIYHIVNGEETKDEKLRKDSLSRFCDPRKILAYGIYRYKITAEEVKKLKEIVHSWCREGVRFDAAFDINTDNKMYCSEMVGKAVERATGKKILFKSTDLTRPEAEVFASYCNLPFSYTKGLSILAIDNLYNFPQCFKVMRCSYEQQTVTPLLPN